MKLNYIGNSYFSEAVAHVHHSNMCAVNFFFVRNETRSSKQTQKHSIEGNAENVAKNLTPKFIKKILNLYQTYKNTILGIFKYTKTV